MQAKCPFSRDDKRLIKGNEYQPFEQEGMRDFFQIAVHDTPVMYNEEIGYYIVTRRKDIMHIMRDVKRFTAAVVLEPVTPIFDSAKKNLSENFCPIPVQVNGDNPMHSRIRKVVAPAFNKKGIEKYISGALEKMVSEDVEKLKGRGRVDMLVDFTYELPCRIICHMIGSDEKDVPDIKTWADSRLALTFGNLNEEEQNIATKNLDLYWNYCEALVQEKIKNPGNDYTSFLLEQRNGDDSILSLTEIASLLFAVLMAGHETTTNMTANALYTLLSNRDSWVELCNDPSLIPNAIEECLRLNGSVVCWRRRALEDVEFSGTTIPKGSNILLALAGGNLDADEFENPNRFDIHRKNAKRHLTFGHGSHVCIGQDIAREEMRVILEQLTQAFPNMTLANEDPLDYIKTISFRGPKHLMVDLNED